MQRRRMLEMTGAASLAYATPMTAFANNGLSRFSVWREDTQIGTHILRFSQTGEQLQVDIEIDLAVKILFIPVYDYKHRNQEQWHAGEFQGFRSETDDNGTPFQVKAVRDGELIVSETLEGRFEHPAIRRPTTYWHRHFLESTQWIDTQKGSDINCQIIEQSVQQLDVLGAPAECEYFKLTGDLKLDLWYRGNDWVKLVFEGEDGSLIDYRLEELEPIDVTFA